MARVKVDISYIKKLQEGDHESFRYIYDVYKEPLYYFILGYIKNVADAEEVLQDTFIMAVKNAKKLEKIESFHSWLYTIAYNRSMRVYRKKSHVNEKIVSQETFDIELFSESKNPSEEYTNDELIQLVSKVIDKMPTKFSSVAKLRYFDDFSVKEIAEILVIPEGTVKNRLSRIRKTLQPALSKQGITPDKYLSVGGFSIIALGIEESMKHSALSSSAVSQCFANVVQATTFHNTAGILSAGILKSILAFSTIGVLGIGVFDAYNQVNTQASEYSTPIQMISYYGKPTNASIEVEVTLNNQDKQDIKLLQDNKNVVYTISGDKLIFTVHENGTYELFVDAQKEVIQITNIDKVLPIVEDIQYDTDKIVVKASDEGSGIDYKKSKAVIGGEDIYLGEELVIDRDVDQSFVIYLYDEVGNVAEYGIDHIEDK